MRILVQEDPFDLGAQSDAFASGRHDMGAIVTFTGVVRAGNGAHDRDGDLDVMEIEHYPGMTEKALSTIAQEATERWTLGDVLIIHRFGRLSPGERIMMVATAAPHRRDAFESAEFLMDYLKSRAPFWKKEHARDGSSWVAAKDEDESALSRW